MLAKDLKKFSLSPNATLFDAMQSINNNFGEVVFITNDDSVVIGVITDGDIRRGLLRDLSLKSSVREIMSTSFISIPESASRVEALDLMKARHVRQLPVLNSEKKLVGVHLLTELVGVQAKPHAAVIMAGGKGSRLGDLTQKCPKPMLTVAGRPILERIILHLVGSGIRKIFISVNYMSEVIQNYFQDGHKFGCEISYIQEPKALGTAGSLAYLPKDLSHPILVMNGDLVTSFDVLQLLESHETSKSVGTVCVRPHLIEIPYGVVSSKEKKVLSIEEKPSLSINVSGGVYVLNPSVLALIQTEEEIHMPELIQRLIQNQLPVGSFELEGDWIDVGRKEDLNRAKGMV